MRTPVERPTNTDYLRKELRRLLTLNCDLALDRRAAMTVAREAHQMTKLMAADLKTQRAEVARLRHELALYGYEADF